MKSEYGDGEQKRDFLYVKDAADMTLFFLDRADANGIFNVGSGQARTWNELAKAVFAAAGKPVNIEYISMPEQIRDRYQYYTCAVTARLRSAGCTHECMSFENAVSDYVRIYLEHGGNLEP
jgi:ADP-L-glycero-D-manno-heptose 6-epimerase